MPSAVSSASWPSTPRRLGCRHGDGIKQAVNKLLASKKLALIRWLQTQVDGRLSDDEMMIIAAEGARALDKREAAYAKRKAR